MLYRTNCALQIKGDRVERGSQVDLSEEEVKALDPADITPLDEIPEPEPETVLADIPLEEMNANQLKDRARELGLSTSGSKADILERITLHLESGEESSPEDEESSEEGEESSPEDEE